MRKLSDSFLQALQSDFLSPLAHLPFASQVKVFYSGFAMWGTSLEGVERL